jgi:chromate transporter
VLAGAWLGLNELLLLLAGGVLGACWIAGVPRRGGVAVGLAPLWLFGLVPVSAAPTLVTLGLYFLRIGATLYGSGYVLIAFLQNELVTGRGWLTQVQLVDAITAGQLTPGPVFSTAAFVGYLLLGVPGALVASAGIFLPSFVFVALTSPRIERLHRGAWSRAFLDSVNVASIALIIAVAIQLGGGTLTGPWQVIIALAGAVVVVTTRVNLAWIILGGAVAGALLLQ